jgi:hypothetical protein
MATDEQYQADVNDAYRAIGRYIAAFSQLTRGLRRMIAEYIGRNEKWVLVDVVLGEAMAAALSHAFFALCRDAGNFSAAETEIEGQLRREIEEEIIPLRNDIAHGDWEVGNFVYPTGGPAKVLPPRIIRIIPHRKHGPYQIRDVKIEELDATTDRLVEVLTMVMEFGKLALGQPLVRCTDEGGSAVSVGEFRVQDVLAVPESTKPRDEPAPTKAKVPENKRAKVSRTGPRAGEVSLLPYVA